jgi:hypothetical protein
LKPGALSSYVSAGFDSLYSPTGVQRLLGARQAVELAPGEVLVPRAVRYSRFVAVQIAFEAARFETGFSLDSCKG